ncbi:MAG: chemotaxis protein CheD [Bdellovibrio sp.]|nr:chemotaxis protein CheD [Bdellovibrio sp.]
MPNGKPIVNINIAEIFVTTDDIVICTVLGSCVSVCLYTEDGTAGGMNHYALPEILNSQKDQPTPLRYGDYSIVQLIREVSATANKLPHKLIAKIIGGANNIASKTDTHDVGTANVLMAKKILSEYKIKIIGEELGGDTGRKVLFHVKSGRLQSAFVGPGFSRPSAAKAIEIKANKKSEAA